MLKRIKISSLTSHELESLEWYIHYGEYSTDEATFIRNNLYRSTSTKLAYAFSVFPNDSWELTPIA